MKADAMVVALVVTGSAVHAQALPPGDVPVPRLRPPLEVADAWVREQPNEDRETAVYLTVWNNDSDAWVITGVVCEDVGSIAIHESREDAGMEHMTSIERVEVAARTTLRMRPGGVHLMLSGLARPFVRQRVNRGIPCNLTVEPHPALPIGRRSPPRPIRFHLSVRADR